MTTSLNFLCNLIGQLRCRVWRKNDSATHWIRRHVFPARTFWPIRNQFDNSRANRGVLNPRSEADKRNWLMYCSGSLIFNIYSACHLSSAFELNYSKDNTFIRVRVQLLATRLYQELFQEILLQRTEILQVSIDQCLYLCGCLSFIWQLYFTDINFQLKNSVFANMLILKMQNSPFTIISRLLSIFEIISKIILSMISLIHGSHAFWFIR